MKLFRRLLFLILVIALLIVIFQNQKSLGLTLEFSFLRWSFSLVLGFWILFAFAAGAALFALIDAWKGLWLRWEIRKRDQEILSLQKELAAAKDKSGSPHRAAGAQTPE